LIPPPGKDEKQEDNSAAKQGTMKSSLVELAETIPATPVVEDDDPALVETDSQFVADTNEKSNNLVPGLDTHFQLKSAGSDIDFDIGYDRKNGLAPTMSVSTILIKRAEKLLPVADKRHYEFEERHSMDCSGSICPKDNPTKV